ncbi:MAG: type II toxin-antitoxin system RelE/ParE family toxin [Anaerolineae bacterium]|nr:type II toxin-antitoxin system RelE/ParE family toxin [Anaerolineae bacterium]
MYRIVFTKQANRALRKMSRDTANLIREKLDQLAQDPYAPNPNLTKLQGRSGYRLRVGDWRVIYELEDDRLVILVLKVAPRGGVYR